MPAGDYREADRMAAGLFPGKSLDSWGDFGQYLYPDSPKSVEGGAEGSALWLGNDFSVQVGFGRNGVVTGCLVSGNRESPVWTALHRHMVKVGW